MNGFGSNGLQHPMRTDSFPDARDPRMGYGSNLSTASGPVGSTDSNETEQTAVVAAPHVIPIRKGQAKKFNWKKGGQSVAKGVSKGFKGAFSSSSQNHYQYQREGQPMEPMPYGMPPVTESPPPGPLSRSTSDTPKHGLGLFGSKPSRPTPTRKQSSGNLTLVAAEPSSELIQGAV